ncbi:MAG: hypothetical protein ABIA97_05820 [Candidatus Omnitrophota bacterium]
MEKEKKVKAAKKYYANIEGIERPWDKETISVAEIRALGNFPQEIEIVEEFPDGTEKTLLDCDTILLKSGHRYGRAPKFKRG